MIAAIAICLAIAIYHVYRETRNEKLVKELMTRMDDLQRDNRALTESLVRSEGKPLIFSKSEAVDGEGWYDTKEQNVTP
jgi:hypothetical protein